MKSTILKFSILILVTCVFYGCSSIIATAYGIKDPKITTIEKTQSYLSKKKITGKDVYFNSATDMSKVTKGGSFSLPDAIFYNKKGQQVEFRVTASECTNDIVKFIENINTINSLSVKEGINLNDLLKHISDSKRNMIEPNEQAEAVVFLNWSTYMGRLNKTVFEWTDILQKTEENNTIKVDYYLLSFDLLDTWEDKHLLKK